MAFGTGITQLPPSTMYDVPSQEPDPVLVALQEALRQQGGVSAVSPEEQIMQALAQRMAQSQGQGWGGPNLMPEQLGATTLSPADIHAIANTSGYAGPLRPSDIPFSGSAARNLEAQRETQLQPLGTERGKSTNRMPIDFGALSGGTPQGAAGPAGRPGAGEVSGDVLAQSAELSRQLKERGVDATTAQLIIESTFPQLKAQREEARLRERREGREDAADIARQTHIFQNAQSYYNSKTGESLAGSKDLNLSPTEILKNYTYLKPQKEKDVQTFDQMKDYIREIREIATSLPLGQADASGRLKSGLSMAELRARGDPRIARFDAAKAQITLLARAFGGDSRVSDKEMELLSNVFTGNWDNRQQADARVKALDRFERAQARALKVPWLRNYEPGVAPGTNPAMPQGTIPRGAAPTFSGPPRVPNPGPPLMPGPNGERRILPGYGPGEQQSTPEARAQRSPAAPAQGAAQLPAGAKPTGRLSGGKPVYMLPNGKLWVQD